MKKETQNDVPMQGKMIASFYDMRGAKQTALEREIEAHISMKAFLSEPDAKKRERLQRHHHETYLEMQRDLARLCKTRESIHHNLTTTVGRSVLAQRLANTTTYTGVINYGALGSDNTAAAVGDTTLATEVFRKVVASGSYSGNISFVDFFYAKADTNGTYEEFGTFIDGTGSADSGQMFSHLITGGWTKSASESMTVACQYTLSNV